jgi:MFS family permease
VDFAAAFCEDQQRCKYRFEAGRLDGSANSLAFLCRHRMALASQTSPGGRAVFAYPSFVRYIGARLCGVMAFEMQSVAVGWRVYEITRSPLALGLTGLMQFLPGILLFLVSGHAADRWDRRRLAQFCYLGLTLCSLALLVAELRGLTNVYPIYAVLLMIGVTRAFNGPALRALLPQLVPINHFPAAVAWDASAFQTATILGPSAGGLLYALFGRPVALYGLAAVLQLGSIVLMLGVQARRTSAPREPLNMASTFAGLRYIWNQKVILGSVSLDLFAVLLGGAVALLPVYASEILRTGPWGLGLLRAAPGLGATATAAVLADRPVRQRAGAVMLWFVAGFGAATVVFAFSRSLAVSLVALVLVGATDMVSVVVRGTLVQVTTPDEMRGRVNAVELMFIGASNQLGQFESGVTAQWFGTVPAVAIGGVGALVVTALWAWIFPELRRADLPGHESEWVEQETGAPKS